MMQASPRLPPRRQAVLAARLAGIVLCGATLPGIVERLALVINATHAEPLGATGYIGGLARALWENHSYTLGSLVVPGLLLLAGLFLLFARGPAFWLLLRRFPA